MAGENLLYLESHEWVLVEGAAPKQTVTIGVSAFAVQQLTDIVYVELPAVGSTFQAKERFGVIESVKATADVYAPVGLLVTEVNAPLGTHLEWMKEDPFGQGWMIKGELLDPADLASLKDFTEYQAQCAEEGH
ncbi:MAG TPA: glycine cleavage system H protein [Pirellulales bacterium]